MANRALVIQNGEDNISLASWPLSFIKPLFISPSCMTLLYDQSDQWKYFLNLSGLDFPLKTNFELVRILKSYRGANDVDGTLLK